MYFQIYSADNECTYTVVIEGVTTDGILIHKEGKIYRKDAKDLCIFRKHRIFVPK